MILRFVVTLGLTLALAGSGCGSDRPARVAADPPPRASARNQGVPEHELVRARLGAELRRRSPASVGKGYACVVSSPDGGPLHLRVTRGGGAVKKARRLIRRLNGARLASVRVAPLEEREELRRDLLRRLRDDAPAGIHGVDAEPISAGSQRCPRLMISLPGDASDRVEQWAARMVGLFGTRRVGWQHFDINPRPAAGG